MKHIKGKYAEAIVYTDNIELEAELQIKTLLDQPFVTGCKIRIMPDVHAGKGCVIGFTAELGDKVVPSLVGCDIGCGVLTVPLGNVDINFKKLDKIIREKVPYGRNIHRERKVRFPELQELHMYRALNDSKAIERSLGTLGQGNHFIEIDVDDEGSKYLIIHTGSRHFGLEVEKYYQSLAVDLSQGKDELFEAENQLIAQYKAEGRRKEIQKALKQLRSEFQARVSDIPKDLAFLYSEYRDQYIHDMRITQKFAALNRFTIADTILSELFNDCKLQFTSTGRIKIKQKGRYDVKEEWFDTVHNYLGNDNIIRKGSVAAYEGQQLIIPINMRDGSLICIGKSNSEYNYSAPHGAGRKMSRTKAKDQLDLADFAESMSGIYTTCINGGTLDESPMAYKGINDIIDNIEDTVTVVKQIKPIYNFKASE